MSTIVLFLSLVAGGADVKIGAFDAPATPPIGSPVAYAPARKIVDPLHARGVVILGAGKPIVLCAVDWIGIGNGGHDVWRERLAKAAGTTPDRVAVHALHQHDGPRCDFTAEKLLEERGLGRQMFHPDFALKVIDDVCARIQKAKADAVPVTHIGFGKAKVEKVASNRRILGDDGKVKIVRYSKSTNPDAIEAAEGTIDPYARVLSFWNGEEPIVALTYYTTHPQSYYGQGDVTSEFVGIARTMRDEATGGLLHVHFNGASGNVAAGKYNDGSPEMRPVLAQRLADGLKAAWNATEKRPISADDLEWKVVEVALPLAPHLNVDRLTATLNDESEQLRARIAAATNLAFVSRMKAGRKIELSRLRIGDVYLVHMPGELFVEYQLAAQEMLADGEVCMAAYGDYGPGYIGTEIAYWEGGYETSQRASKTAPNVERILMPAIKKLLE